MSVLGDGVGWLVGGGGCQESLAAKCLRDDEFSVIEIAEAYMKPLEDLGI